MEKVPHQTEEGRQVNLSLLLACTSFLPPTKNAVSQTPHLSLPYLPANGFHLNLKYSVILGEEWRSQVEYYIILWKLASPLSLPSSPPPPPFPPFSPWLGLLCAQIYQMWASTRPTLEGTATSQAPFLPGSRPWGTSWKMQEWFGIQLRPVRSRTDCSSEWWQK